MRAWLKQFPGAEKLARQLMALYPLSARLGPLFWRWYAFLKESESWTPEALRQFQLERLRALLRRLAKTSPFYARRLAGVPLDELQSPEDLRRSIPPLTRQEFAANYQDIRSRAFRVRRALRYSTSGTTGNALELVHPAQNRALEWASICHQWARVGFDPVRSRRAEFRGLTRNGALYQEFPEQNMVRFSILDLRAESLPRIAEVIAARELRFFFGYPSALFLLAQAVLKTAPQFPQPEAVLLASEMVYEFQLQALEAAFPKTRLFAHYGCTECTVLAAWCEHRRVYHVLPQYSLVEVDPATGEILGTNLYNDLNGLVRYRMTDRASEVETAPCPACRRPYTPILTGLEGRQEDYLYSPERGWIAPAIVTYPLKHLHSIQEVQFLQEERDQITLNYLLRPGAGPESVLRELSEIQDGLRQLLGNSTHVRACRVEDIPRGPTGKFKWIVSRLDPPTAVAGRP